MISIRCVHRLSEADAYRGSINALNLASARPDPFSTFEFYAHYLRHARAFPGGEGLRLWLLLAFGGDELVGYLALKQGSHRIFGIRASRLDLLTAYVADRPHLVTRPGDAQRVGTAMYAYLLGRSSEWSQLEFAQQDAASALLPPPPEATRGAFRFRQWPNMAVGIIPVRWDSPAAYFAALSKKARSNVSRQMRALLAAGDVQLLSSSTTQASEALFELYRCIEPHSWKAHADAAIGRNRQSVDFYCGLISDAQPMNLLIQVLVLDGVPIAGLVSAAFGKGLYALHIVYDERHAHLGPGSAIFWLGMRLAIEGGYEFVNLLWGSGHYKSRWLAEMREVQSLQIYRVGTPFYWRRSLGDLWRRVRGKSAVQSSTLFNPVRRSVDKPVTLLAAAEAVPLPGRAERAAHAALIQRVRRCHGEFLSTAQLAAAMPFATGPPPGVANPGLRAR